MDEVECENDLRRKVLRDGLMNGSFEIRDCDFVEIEEEPADTVSKCISTDDLDIQHQYMKVILEFWGRKPNPALLFNVQKWESWIRKVAFKREELPRFSDPSVLTTFASTLLQMFCDQKLSYLHNTRNYLDENQYSELLRLKEQYEEDEDAKLVAEANCSSNYYRGNKDCGSSGLIIKSVVSLAKYADDHGKNNRSPLNLNQARYFDSDSPSPKCTMDRSPSPPRIFGRIPSTKDCTAYRRASLSPDALSLTRKRHKRISTSSSTSDNGFRKKHRSENSASSSHALKLKVRKLSVEDNNSEQATRSKEQIIPPTKYYNQDDSFFEKSSDYTSYDNDVNYDLVIENETPPCSPRTVEDDTDEDIKRNDANGSTRCVSPINIHRKDSVSNVNNSSKAPESKSESRRSKGIRIRPRLITTKENKPLTPSASNKTHDDSTLELPDLDAPIEDKENYPVSSDEIATQYPKPPSGPPLTLEMFEALKEVMDKPPKEKIVSGFSLYILQEDLAVYHKDTEWLNDRNIDFYLELLKERSTRPGYPKVYIFHSFFYTLLTDKDGGYELVMETTGEEDLLKYDIIFFPINLNQHWRLVVVEFQQKTLKCYDSMKHDNCDVLKQIGKYLRKEYHRKHRSGHTGNALNGDMSAYSGSEDDRSSPMPVMCNNIGPSSTREFFDSDAWTVENVSSETIPQQKNAIDCGVFVLQYAEYLSRKKEFDFDQSHVPYFRKRMMYETLTKKLLTSSGSSNENLEEKVLTEETREVNGA